MSPLADLPWDEDGSHGPSLPPSMSVYPYSPGRVPNCVSRSTYHQETTTTTSCDLAKSGLVKKTKAPHIRSSKVAHESALDARWALDKVLDNLHVRLYGFLKITTTDPVVLRELKAIKASHSHFLSLESLRHETVAAIYVEQAIALGYDVDLATAKINQGKVYVPISSALQIAFERFHELTVATLDWYADFLQDVSEERHHLTAFAHTRQGASTDNVFEATSFSADVRAGLHRYLKELGV